MMIPNPPRSQQVVDPPLTQPQLSADRWLPVLQDALAQQGRFTVPLRGNSMRPSLPEACEIEIQPLTRPPRRGELIVFVLEDTLVAHRFVQWRRGFLVAQGDNRRGPDIPLRLVQVLGRVTAARVDGRPVWPSFSEPVIARFWVGRYHFWRAARWLARHVMR
jgi:hypothetical protein